ncbi:MAG: hypothetical protein KGL39_11490 [Patescibacteria group bacterium]|nr:hypothetical protein [Patescibacteria group bacterium]
MPRTRRKAAASETVCDMQTLKPATREALLDMAKAAGKFLAARSGKLVEVTSITVRGVK